LLDYLLAIKLTVLYSDGQDSILQGEVAGVVFYLEVSRWANFTPFSFSFVRNNHLVLLASN
jgi:hypothetical protein